MKELIRHGLNLINYDIVKAFHLELYSLTSKEVWTEIFKCCYLLRLKFCVGVLYIYILYIRYIYVERIDVSNGYSESLFYKLKILLFCLYMYIFIWSKNILNKTHNKTS